MTTRPKTRSGSKTAAQAAEIVAALRQAVEGGDRHWFLSVLEAIRLWPLADERVGERRYRYLVGGQAFDWLLLAERLCEPLDGLIPGDECQALLFHGRLPLELSDDELRRLMGPSKYRAHLNFLYGVRVEEALQLAVEEDVHKDRLSRVWENGQVDDEVFHRVYGAGRAELLASFWRDYALPDGDRLSVGDLKEFTYWLFQHRLRNCDPARVASDTRKGLARLAELESQRKAAPRGQRQDGQAP